MKRTFWLILVAFSLVCAFSQAQSVEIRGLRFVVQPGINTILDQGYLYLRLNVTNLTQKERSVRLFFDNAHGNELETVSKKFTIGALESREESLIFPTIDFSSRGLEVEIDGQGSESRLTSYIRTYSADRRLHHTLADSNFSRQEIDDLFGAGSPLEHMNLNVTQFEGSNSQLFKDWLGYTQYGLLFFYGKTLTSFEPEIREAIYDYVRMGGKLVCLGRTAIPDDFRPVAGSGSINKIQVYAAGFGQITVIDKHDIADLKSDDLSAISRLRLSSASIGYGRGTSPVAFRDQDLESVSTTSLLIAIYIFAFFIGPVNIYWLYKYGRKIYVFWTVPAFSVLFCGLFFSYYLIMERPLFKARQISLTLLDQESARAMTNAELGVYSAKNRSEGMHFPMTAEIMPYRNSVEFPKVINLDRSQHFSLGWLRPRVPRYFSIRQLESRREQIQLSQNGESYNLLNGLGADIIEITVFDHSSRMWHAKNIAAGATDRLSLLDSSGSNDAMDSKKNYVSPVGIYDSGWHRMVKDFHNLPAKFLQPGMYLARLRHCPFFPDRFGGRADLSVDSYVIGILKRES